MGSIPLHTSKILNEPNLVKHNLVDY